MFCTEKPNHSSHLFMFCDTLSANVKVFCVKVLPALQPKSVLCADKETSSGYSGKDYSVLFLVLNILNIYLFT